MSSAQEDMQPFDESQALESYDPWAVSEEIFWPLVNSFFGRNFRADHKKNKLEIVKSTEHEGEDYRAGLNAHVNTVLAQGTSHYGRTIYTVELSLTQIVHDYRRDLLLERAIEAQAEPSYNLHESEDITERNPDELEVKTVTGYSTCNFDGFNIFTHQSVDWAGVSLWNSYEITPDEDDNQEEVDYIEIPESKLQQSDLDIIEKAIYVLQGPEAILKALQVIRANPLPI